jgi:hypothetical protein
MKRQQSIEQVRWDLALRNRLIETVAWWGNPSIVPINALTNHRWGKKWGENRLAQKTPPIKKSSNR